MKLMPSSAGGATMSLPSTVALLGEEGFGNAAPDAAAAAGDQGRSPSRSFMLMVALPGGDRWRPRPDWMWRWSNVARAETARAAQRMIMAGLVFSNDKRLDKAGQGVTGDAPLEVRGQPHPYVSRGRAEAREGARPLRYSGRRPRRARRLSSTGGFTDCLLQRGAAKVYAVDVGPNQLAWKLRTDPRVVSMEKTNIRNVGQAQIPEPIDLIVCDAPRSSACVSCFRRRSRSPRPVPISRR